MKKYLLVTLHLAAGFAAIAAEPNPLTAPLAAQKPTYLETSKSVDERVADLLGVSSDHSTGQFGFQTQGEYAPTSCYFRLGVIEIQECKIGVEDSESQSWLR